MVMEYIGRQWHCLLALQIQSLFFTKDTARSSSLQENEICQPFALKAHSRMKYVTLSSTSSRGRNLPFRLNFTETTNLQHAM